MNPLGIGGGPFAAHAYLRAFSDISDGNIDIVLADSWREQWDEKIRIKEKYIATPLSLFNYATSLITNEIQRYSGVAEKLLLSNPGKYSYLISNGSSISGKLCDVVRRLGVKLITIHHNYEPEYFADNTKGMRKCLYLPIVRRLERKAYLNSDINMFLTNQDKDRFYKEYGENHQVNAVIGVFEFDDYQFPIIQKAINKQLTFVITGTLCTMQGIDGVKYFFDELYHFLPSDSRVVIAGRSPSDEIVDLCGKYDNVDLIPNPNDIKSVISKGDIYICPTRVGGGLKLRVMDGLKLGIPVITHSCSARGYDAFYGTAYFKSFSCQIEFKKSLEMMMSELPIISKRKIVEMYQSVFSYESGLSRMKKIFIR